MLLLSFRRLPSHLSSSSFECDRRDGDETVAVMPMPPARPSVVAAAAAFLLAASVLIVLDLPLFVGAACDLSLLRGNTLYNYSLTSPTKKFPHGVLSEDGFYKIAVNTTFLWFQLCGRMIFNHDPPRCFGCEDCGGPSRCGMTCSALVANDIGGYPVCSAIGQTHNIHISAIDENNPQKGVVVKTSTVGKKNNCSLAVSVFCDRNKAHLPSSLDVRGECDYATELTHPSGCAKMISVDGGGWGWFGTLMLTLACLLGAYLLVGTVYRFYFLGIRGAEAIPNLEFWLGLPQRARSMLGSLVRRFRSHIPDRRGHYTPIDH